jgi:hypothetical protein
MHALHQHLAHGRRGPGQSRHDAFDHRRQLRDRHVPPDPTGAQQGFQVAAGAQSRPFRREETGAGGQSTIPGPRHHLRPVEEQAPAVVHARQPFVANPAVDDPLVDSKRFRQLDDV